jgi:ABC-type molybdate transport system permease subunit
MNRRRPDGRQLPYRALRTLAKLYIVLAPLVLGTMLLIGVVMLAGEAPLGAKLGTFVGMSLVGTLYYLIMKSVAQAIYLMFDVSSDTSLLRELNEAVKTQAGNQAKLAASLRELNDLLKGSGLAKAPASS